MRTRRLAWIWGTLAAANVAAGIWRAFNPIRSHDLRIMHRWAQLWLLDHTNLYRVHRLDIDYPPPAVVLLSPLGLLSDSAAVAFWVLLQTALVPVAAWLALRLARPQARPSEVWLFACLFASWCAVRTGLWSGQISLVLLVLGLASVSAASRSPVAGGALIGAGLIKPHIGAPFLAWALATFRVHVLVWAAATFGALWLVYCAVAGVGPVAVLSDYSAGLRFLYANVSFASILVGDTDLREIWRAIAPSPWIADAAHVVTMVGLTAVAWRTLSARRDTAPVPRDVVAVAMGGVLSLLAFFNLQFNLVLALPAMAVLWARLASGEESRPWRRGLFWLLQGLLVLGIPSLTKLPLPVPHGFEPVMLALQHVDRVVVVLLYVSLLGPGARSAGRHG